MLRNVLGDYLDRITERECDLPLLLLLPVLGFYDVHFTHGPVEFGKDVIAKKLDGDPEVQYSFQSKAGNITQSAWRREVRGQLETALWSSLSHPNFDRNLPHQVVLLTTGDLRHNASIELQEFNDTISQCHQWRPIVCWGKHHLIELLVEHGLSGSYRATAEGFVEFGRFFSIYADALQGEITVQEIESYSRQWSSNDVHHDRRLLLSAIESEVLAEQCLRQDLVYEAVQLHLARLRLLCELTYSEAEQDLQDSWDEASQRLYDLCASYTDNIRSVWATEHNMVKTWFGDLYMTTYPVQCARIMELAGLAYFLSGNEQDRQRHAEFVRDFLSMEPGCFHPISDRFAISVVLAMLVLIDSGDSERAAHFLERTTVWLCDRYEDRMGLAGVEAGAQSETNALLGFPFDFIDVPHRHDSFVATAKMDLAAYLGDSDLYADIVNDLKAVRIFPEYWQPQDTMGACRIEGDDVLYYPSVGFAEMLPTNGEPYAEHVSGESLSFRFVKAFGPTSTVMIAALLRDRYFPGLWLVLKPLQAPSPKNVTELDGTG